MSERSLKIAVVGATGAVGTRLLSILDERKFPTRIRHRLVYVPKHDGDLVDEPEEPGGQPENTERENDVEKIGWREHKETF